MNELLKFIPSFILIFSAWVLSLFGNVYLDRDEIKKSKFFHRLSTRLLSFGVGWAIGMLISLLFK